jgi:hypothetical protein
MTTVWLRGVGTTAPCEGSALPWAELVAVLEAELVVEAALLVVSVLVEAALLLVSVLVEAVVLDSVLVAAALLDVVVLEAGAELDTLLVLGALLVTAALLVGAAEDEALLLAAPVLEVPQAASKEAAARPAPATSERWMKSRRRRALSAIAWIPGIVR